MKIANSHTSIRVVHVIHSFGIGGLEKGITTLINHGSSRIEHIVVSLTPSRESEKRLHRKIEIITLDKPRGNSFGFILALSRVLRKIKPDIVHTRNWSGMDGIIAAKLAGIKRIIHGEHGWDMSDPFGSNSKRKAIRRLFSTMVTQYTCVSKQLKSWLTDDVKVKRHISQIYNGVDMKKFSPPGIVEKNDIKKKLGFGSGDIIVGTVGRLDPIKNHIGLIKAFDSIVDKYPESKLVVVGDGPERRKIEEAGSSNVIFLGYRNDTDRLMKSFDFFVLPSFNEGISNTILEAMATGLPVIASNVGGNPELVKNGFNGFLFKPENLNELGEMMLEYFKKPDLLKFHGENARNQVCSSYSILSMVNSYESVYTSCL